MGNSASVATGKPGSPTSDSIVVVTKDVPAAISGDVVIVSEKETAAAAAEAPKKKICCACPETKKLRDECVVEHGPDACGKWIDAHLQCLRSEGFKI